MTPQNALYQSFHNLHQTAVQLRNALTWTPPPWHSLLQQAPPAPQLIAYRLGDLYEAMHEILVMAGPALKPFPLLETHSWNYLSWLTDLINYTQDWMGAAEELDETPGDEHA